MKEKIKKVDETDALDILLGMRAIVRPSRPAGRLKQLNKHAKKMRRLHAPLSETDKRNQS